jgi:hypothetical protein
MALPATAGPLKAGVARVDITPPLGLTMYGYGGRKAGATGVRDPLMARVLVLEAGDTRIAMVGLDLGEPPALAWVKRLRENASKSSGISYVLVTATHTHAGPDIRPAFPATTPPDWESDALAKIGRAIDEAHQHAVEARIGTGYGSVLIGHNRLRLEARRQHHVVRAQQHDGAFLTRRSGRLGAAARHDGRHANRDSRQLRVPSGRLRP